MLLVLNRKVSEEYSTIGELLINGVHQCWICEDVIREPKERPTDEGKSQFEYMNEMVEWVKTWKVMSKTAIPSGTYRIIITYSQRFKKLLPILVNVPGFTGIRIHPGNDAVDTDGCLLPGITEDNGKVWNSRVAFEELYELISTELLKGDVVKIQVNNA